MASLRKLTELSPLFLCTVGGSVTVGDGWRRGLMAVSSAWIGFCQTQNTDVDHYLNPVCVFVC